MRLTDDSVTSGRTMRRRRWRPDEHVVVPPPAAPPPRVAARAALKVTRPVLRSEFTKFRSLRSTLWTLLIAVVLMSASARCSRRERQPVPHLQRRSRASFVVSTSLTALASRDRVRGWACC